MGLGKDTIAAIATAAGRGGVGIVRLSGPAAETVAGKIFRCESGPLPSSPAHKLVRGTVVDPVTGETIDDGLAVRMPAPHSYTGEDSVELQLHGSPATLSRTVALALACGARLAEPGEFTRRAFLNGKIDLVQAEAVAELIGAQSEAEARAARKRLDGALSSSLAALRENVISVLAECEADIDFPDENLPLAERPELTKKIKEIQFVGSKLRTTYETNRRLRDGFAVVLVGRPNVGKSSLFNALLEADRAIVTPIPGTTRDLLREELVLRGRRVRLTDTAGLRSGTGDAVEQIGMERAAGETKEADLVCVVCSAPDGMTVEDERIFREAPADKRWIVWNKTDLSSPPLSAPAGRNFAVSALLSRGVAELREALGTEAEAASPSESEGGISNDRQKELLDEFLSAVSRTEAAWKENVSPEFVAFEFRRAHRALSRLVGKDEGIEDILTEIFSRFCIGK